MSMISEQVKELREYANGYKKTCFGIDGIVKVLEQAADTIETLSAKLSAANMERSERYYGDTDKLIGEMAEEIENCYGRETELSQRAREYLCNVNYGGGWIACEDRLPKENEDVLYYSPYENIGIAYISNGNWRYTSDSEFISTIETSSILAWQPLPGPYIEDKI